jgi:hypothetical protein
MSLLATNFNMARVSSILGAAALIEKFVVHKGDNAAFAKQQRSNYIFNSKVNLWPFGRGH